MGFFGRLFNVISGFFNSLLGNIEAKNPELVYENTIQERLKQQKELKKAEKLFESGDVKGASEILVNSKSLFESADQKILLQKIYLEAKIDQENGNFQSSYDKYKNYTSLGGKDSEYDNQIIKLIVI